MMENAYRSVVDSSAAMISQTRSWIGSMIRLYGPTLVLQNETAIDKSRRSYFRAKYQCSGSTVSGDVSRDDKHYPVGELCTGSNKLANGEENVDENYSVKELQGASSGARSTDMVNIVVRNNNISRNTEVSPENRESVEEQNVHSTIRNSVMSTTDDNLQSYQTESNEGRIIEDTMQKENDNTFSTNYSKFCENLSNLQNNVVAKSTTKKLERGKSCHPMLLTNPKRISNSKNPPDVGRVQISMQYFENTHQLRVILHEAVDLKEHIGKVCIKISLSGKCSTKKEISQKVHTEMGKANFKETMYIFIDPDKDDIDVVHDCMLRIRLCVVSGILRRAKPIGEAVIVLEKMDLHLDTNMWITLRHPTSCQSVS